MVITWLKLKRPLGLATLAMAGLATTNAFSQDSPTIKLNTTGKTWVDGHGVVRINPAKNGTQYPIDVAISANKGPFRIDKKFAAELRLTAVEAFVVDPEQSISTSKANPTELTTVSIPDTKENTAIKIIARATYDEYVDAQATAKVDGKTRLKDSVRPVQLMIDTAAPLPTGARIESFPGGGGTVIIQFADGDLDPASIIPASNISVQQVHNAATKTSVTPIDAPRYNESKQEVSIRFATLPPGQFAITLADVADRLGNKITSAKSVVLSADIPSGRQQGDHIAYPDYLGIENKVADKKPGERVETRVVRLYYNRDAHRVVQVINRNAKQLNRSGYDQAQQLAEQARSAANEKQDRRRQLERAAVQTAETFRKLDREKQEKTTELNKAQATADKHNQQIHEVREAASNVDTGNISASAVSSDIVIADMITAYQARITMRSGDLRVEEKKLRDEQIKPQADQNQPIIDAALRSIATIKAEVAELEGKLAQLKRLKNTEDRIESVATSTNTLVTDLKTRLNTIDGNIDSARQAAQQAQEEAQQAEAAEQRFTTEAFRREVIAGQADPDTYAAGEKTSIDPVTQVSMTVIGEGVIQLRGPIRGINKIRRMIHDIDAPVGQVKVGIHTVQVNGEHGDRMELVYERIDKHIAHSRFMANQSGQLFRRAVAEVATAVATSVRRGQMIPRDDFPVAPGVDQGQIKFLVAFFGRDFINELCKMDSELLSSDNRLLSLHSMDTLSLAGAMNVVGLADNMVRELVMKRFQQLVESELPQSEFEYYKALTHTRHADPILNEIAIRCKQDRLDAKDCKKLALNAARTYNYPNTKTFFGTNSKGQFYGTTGFVDLDDNAVGALNPLQYATIRMAQSLKAQLVAELEYKQLLFEYSLLPKEETTDYQKIIDEAAIKVRSVSDAKQVMDRELTSTRRVLEASIQAVSAKIMQIVREKKAEPTRAHLSLYLNHVSAVMSNEQNVRELGQAILPIIESHVRRGGSLSEPSDDLPPSIVNAGMSLILSRASRHVYENYTCHKVEINQIFEHAMGVAIKEQLEKLVPVVDRFIESGDALANADAALDDARRAKKEVEKKGFQIRMLEQFIDEQEEKSVELLEAMRSHSSNIDNYLKRQAIAFEDDLQAQFYNPAFQDVRRASRYWDVNLGQIETTTILTNNRTLAKVDPSATMEFDLPKRDILINEAMKGAKAVATEYGALMHDPTFLAATSLQSGQSATGLLDKNSPLQKVPGLPADGKPQFGTSFDKLIPDPAVYKFETGTGFQIRPVIQPDGHSIVYDFDYTYTTNVREPVKADEKHLGRVKRHYIHTDVQTSSFELREVSRYVVALKASRTSKGVPLLEDIPLVGLAFRPLPSDESSLQMNVILASSTIYPTQYDLMGLRWSPYADQVESEKLRKDKEIQRTRREDLREQLLNRIRANIDESVGPDNSNRMSPGPRVNPQEYPNEPMSPGPQINDYRRGPDARSNVHSQPRLPVMSVPPRRTADSGVEDIGRIRPSADRSANSLIQPMSYVERQTVGVPVSPSRQTSPGKSESTPNTNGGRPATTARPTAPAAPQRVIRSTYSGT